MRIEPVRWRLERRKGTLPVVIGGSLIVRRSRGDSRVESSPAVLLETLSSNVATFLFAGGGAFIYLCLARIATSCCSSKHLPASLASPLAAHHPVLPPRACSSPLISFQVDGCASACRLCIVCGKKDKEKRQERKSCFPRVISCR